MSTVKEFETQAEQQEYFERVKDVYECEMYIEDKYCVELIRHKPLNLYPNGVYKPVRKP